MLHSSAPYFIQHFIHVTNEVISVIAHDDMWQVLNGCRLVRV